MMAILTASALILSSQVQPANTEDAESGYIYSISGFPALFYTPETSFMAGGGGIITFRKTHEPERYRPDSISAYSIYSVKNQFALTLIPDFYLLNDKLELKSVLSYQNWPGMFYGIGPDSEEDDGEEFTSEDMMIQPSVLVNVAGALQAGLIYDLKKTNVLQMEKSGFLAGGGFPGTDGSVLSGAGPSIAWDTRDNTFSAHSGAWYQLYCSFYRKWMGSDFEYQSYTADFRHYVSPRPGHTLAVQLTGNAVRGDVTFNEYATLSGLRGIETSRFRDRNTAILRVEYRFPVFRKFRGVVFAGCGQVAPHLNEITQNRIKYSAGFGFRYALNSKERIYLRFDMGFSPWGSHPYFQMMEAF